MIRPDALLFTIAFSAYMLGFIGFILDMSLRKEVFSKIALFLMIAGIIPHTLAFIVRWTAQGHYPLANMYEYMGMMAWMVVLGLIYFSWRFGNRKIGIIVAPVAVMLLVTASLLPADSNRQLMPALQSAWLAIHVSMAALGSGAFLISFATASLYLLSKDNGTIKPAKPANEGTWFSFTLFWIVVPVLTAFILSATGLLPAQARSFEEARIHGISGGIITSFNLSNGSSSILMGKAAIGLGIGMIVGAMIWMPIRRKMSAKSVASDSGGRFFAVLVISLLLAAVLAGFLIRDGILNLTPRSYLKIFEFFGPVLVISWIFTPLVYYLLLVIGGGWIDKLHLPRTVLEELSYSSVAIGYPLYTVGALFAGAIWAEQAWGTWWSWDPKEVGALIIWLFYTGFLHARYQRQWKGQRAAVLVILGMVMVFVSFFGNYFFGGLHSYE
ncbi:cytochrome c biogenesis protein CcsA [Calditrichota bacterium]